MPRAKHLDRPIRFEVTLPESLKSAMELELWSDLEGRVPYGKASELIRQLVREWLRSRGTAAPGLGWKLLPLRINSTDIYLAFNYLTDSAEAFFTEQEGQDFISTQAGVV